MKKAIASITTPIFNAVLKKLKPEDQAAEITRLFRRTFKDEQDQIVLRFILDDLCYFTQPENQEDVARRNYATELLHERLGITDTIAVTSALMNTVAKE